LSGKRIHSCILVVEDSDTQRRIICAALRRQGLIVLEAENGAIGLEMAGNETPALIISDVEMPEMDGLALCRAIRSDVKLAHIPVLILTTLNSFGQFKRAFEAGANDYIIKPQQGEREVFLHTLNNRVRALLAHHGIGEKGRVLVVDDSSTMRKITTRALESGGYAVTTVQDGLAAKDLLESSERLPDIIVTDTDMPRMNGLELIHWMKHNTRTKHIPTLLLSGTREEASKRMSTGVGADGFLSKPHTKETLIVAVDQILSKAQMSEERAQLSALVGAEVLDAVRQHKLEPAREVVTILFVDIVGFTSVCASWTPLKVIELLNWFFGHVVECVEREGGNVNKFIGDAAMAFFASGETEESGPVRAVAAGLQILRGLEAYNLTHEPSIHMRIGINKGPVIVGLVGGKERQDYTAIGDHVNRAQRLEGSAPEDSLCVSESVWCEFEGAYSDEPPAVCRFMGELTLKGLIEPVSAWSIKPAPHRPPGLGNDE
jgi:CheY-like chemotaxis protein/class 3 adenylate cyclase